jgi:CHAT domain-containing protein
LVLTPPDIGTSEDDGLLTASEVAQLKLNADWVILSACNTAAADTPGARGLSGLAKAFFYAGARALLVSHWPVESNAATQLTSRMFDALKNNPTLGRAEALRQSMMTLANNPNTAHPFFWAPFVVVGEGGQLQ